MSQLVFHKFKGNSVGLVNGVFKNAFVFIYNGPTNGIITDNVDNDYQDEIDKNNMLYIKFKIGAMKEENDLEMTQDWVKNRNKGDNKFLNEKFSQIKILNNETAHFILKYLDRMYWRNKGGNGKQFNTQNDNLSTRSTFDIDDMIEIIVPAAKDLKKILRKELDNKYPNVLIDKVIEDNVQAENLKQSQKTGGKLGKI